MYLFKGEDGRPCACPQPEPQQPTTPQTQPMTFWQFIQGAAVVAGLIVSVREMSRW